MSTEEFNNYNPEIILVPANWYYSFLDHKQKRPDYKRITGVAVLGDLYASLSDKDGYIDGEFCLDGKNTGGLHLDKDTISFLEEEYIGEKSHRIFIDIITGMAQKNKEYGYLAGYLLSDLIDIIDHTNSSDNSLSVPKNEWLRLFNETPQRIRRALELLKKLSLITFLISENHFEISINIPAQIIPFNKKETNE